MNAQDINLEAARDQFCGPGKRISPAQMDGLDQEIANARSGRNRALKKELKLRYSVCHYLQVRQKG